MVYYFTRYTHINFPLFNYLYLNTHTVLKTVVFWNIYQNISFCYDKCRITLNIIQIVGSCESLPLVSIRLGTEKFFSNMVSIRREFCSIQKYYTHYSPFAEALPMASPHTSLRSPHSSNNGGVRYNEVGGDVIGKASTNG